MHTQRILQQWLNNVLIKMHKKRHEALSLLVSAAIEGGRLTVTSLGRSIDSNAKEKHNIKRADRLLSNKHLQFEVFCIYKKLAREIIGQVNIPIILIDWSDIEQSQNFFLLRASTSVKGRSLTIYEEVHTVRTKEKPKTHMEFLSKLKEILPLDCKPIIITDAGFRVPWFKQVQNLGWDFIGRVRNRDKVLLDNKSQWIGIKSLYSQATTTPRTIGNILLTKRNSFKCIGILYKSKSKGRKKFNRKGNESKRIRSVRNAKRGREPWFLVSSLDKAAKKIIKLYSTRMQIEESFRDLKCIRNGFGFDLTRSYKIERIKVLVLIGTLAAVFTWILGKAVKLAGMQRQFQANTVRTTAVLSNVFIGIKFFKKNRLKIPIGLFISAQREAQQMIKSFES